MRQFRFWAIQTALCLLLLEGGLSLGFYLLRGYPAWQQQEVFGIGDLYQRVADARGITLKPGVKRDYHFGALRWRVETDANGFRAGVVHPGLKGNVVFIGDSIPFGWKLDAAQSAPGQLQRMLEADRSGFGVINAAVPSTSLDQAVARYLHEIHDQVSVDTLVLQAYDPVTQFSLLGRGWTVAANWASAPRRATQALGWLRFSAIYQVARMATADGEREMLDPGDAVAYARFRDGIRSSLDRLDMAARGKIRRTILLPLAVPKKARSEMSPQRARAIEVMNATLREYAARHAGFVYLDLNARLAPLTDNQAFLDLCCHLSAQGAQAEAALIHANL